jgi:hypothetical protein
VLHSNGQESQTITKKVSLISYHQAKRQIKTKGYGLGPFDGKGQGQVPQGMLKGRR